MERRDNRVGFVLTSIMASLVLTLAGCGSGLGGILGGGDSAPSTASEQVSGTVERVDTRERAILLDVHSSALRGGTQGVLSIYYDDETVVEHEGAAYPPSALEPGDRVTALVQNVNGRAFTRQVRVDYDSSPYDEGGTRDQGTSGSSWDEMRGRGTVQWVDTRSRTVELENVDWATRSGTTERIVIEYDDRTRVEMDGRSYGIASLDRGDYVEFVATDARRPYARSIVVVRDTSRTPTNTWGADLRGTVTVVDTRSRYVELERGTERWSSNFSTGAPGSTGDMVRIYYDDRTVVEYQGRNYRPTNLERGDVVDVWTDTVNGRLYSERMVVVQDVNQRY